MRHALVAIARATLVTKSDAAAAAKLPLHRFPAKANYVVEEIRYALLPRPAEPEFAPRLADRRIEPTL